MGYTNNSNSFNLIKQLKNRLKTYGELVMFSHTLFSLPFAGIAVLLAAHGVPNTHTLFWMFMALVAGRNGANALNRYVDQHYDALNPRTQNRHMPKGLVSSKETLLITVFCYILFIFSAAMLGPECLILSPFGLILFTLYSYTKRFTWFCHLVLGATCAGAPVGAWIAVTGELSIVPFVLAGIVMLWVSGFDILYGTQDIHFDRDIGLFSIPAYFGFNGARIIAGTLHICMCLLLILLVLITELSLTFSLAIGISVILLLLEHYLVDPSHRKKMNFVSYHLNQIISSLLFVMAAVDILFI